MLNAKLFGHLEPAPKPPHMDKISIKRLDRRIRATLVHELFHDFWHNILDERRRYLFSSEAELFFIELMLAKTDEERLRFLRNSGYTQPEEVHFDSFEVLLEIKEMYNPQKTFGTELYATLAGRAFSEVTIIPKQLRKYYLSIISDEILNRNSLPLSRAPRKIKKKHEAIFIDSRDEYGFTRLHHAAYSGHKEAVQFLIEKGAEVNAEATSCAWTPVFLACLSGHLDTAEWLIGNGALIDLKDIRGRSPLHIAALRGHAKIIDLLLRLGAELDSQDAAGMTPLHAAALRGRKETASLLISLGADAKLKDSAGQTPLHIACLNGDEEVVKLLISEGVHVNERDYRGETALHIAAFCGHKKVVEFLIAHGAKFEIRNIEGKTPLEIASRARHEQIVEILRRAVS